MASKPVTCKGDTPYWFPVKWELPGPVWQHGAIIGFSDDGNSAIIVTEDDKLLLMPIKVLRMDRQ